MLIIPYAIPGFLSLLVWGGLLNDDFGVVNQLLGTSITSRGCSTRNWAKVSVILVSIWLTLPYFFLVSLGALQSIPAELIEAARVDGGGGWQVFRRVTLPLLLVAVAPLMIASFAFNFNNFGNIYLLTGGGPSASDQSIAGATDILISYTYKLAFASGKGQDYGLASAVVDHDLLHRRDDLGVVVRRTKALENLAMTHRRADRSRRRPPHVARRRRGAARRPKLGDKWWRHVGRPRRVARLRSSRSRTSSRRRSTRDDTLSGASLIPAHVTFDNFRELLRNALRARARHIRRGGLPRWYVNTMIVAGATAFLTVHARRARGVRVQPLPLQGPAHRDALRCC